MNFINIEAKIGIQLVRGLVVCLDVYYVTDVIIKISVRDVIMKRFLR